MCGRARCTLRPEDVPAACGFRAPLNTLHGERFRPSFNVSPGSYMPIVRYLQEENNKGPMVHYMKWGLVPSFTKQSEQPDYFRMFNARSESVHEKASFRRLLPKCRCLATVEGFYEWKKDGTKKQPYYIHFSDARPLVFAALYDCWIDSKGEALYTFTILTTRSSKALEWLHDRMPVILGNQQAVDDWLNGDISTNPLQALMRPYEDQDLVWYPVTPAMGKTSYDGPECIKQLKIGAELKNSIVQLFGKQKHPAQLPFKQPKMEPSKEEDDAKHLDNSLLDEKELTAFLAGLEPDVDISERKAVCKTDNEEETKGHFVLTPDKKENTALRCDICPGFEQTKATSAKGLKRKSPEPSPRSKAKAATTGVKDGQRSLLNFFGKQ